MDDFARRRRVQRSLPRRAWRLAWRSLLGLLALVVLLVAALLVSLKFEAARAAVVARVDGALAGLFQGRLRLQRLESIGFYSLRATGRVEDPDGRTIVRFDHVSVSTSFPALVWDLVANGGSPSAISIDEVRIEHAEVWLRDDGTGVPTLAKTFEPKTKGPPSSEPSPQVTLRRIALQHAWLHGQLGGGPLIDADISHLVASLALEPSKLGVTLERASIRGRFEPYALNPRGEARGKLEVPLDERPLSLSARYRGDVAETALEASASMNGDALSAEVTLPALERRTLARFSPDLALVGTMRVTASATGTTDDLGVQLTAVGKPGSIDARARIQSGEKLRVTAAFDAQRLDASSLVADTPSTNIDTTGSLTLEVSGERLDGDYELTTEPGRVAGELVPAVATFGTLRQRGSRLELEGDAAVDEPGAELALSYRVDVDGERGAVEAEVQGQLDEPPRLLEQSGLRTGGGLVARARFAWPGDAFAVSASADLTGLTHAAVRLGPTRVRATAEGTPSAPRFTASVLSGGVSALGHRFTGVRATADGTPAMIAVRLETGREREQLDARAQLSFRDGGLDVPNATVTFSGDGGSLLASVLDARFGANGVQVSKFILDGAGHAAGSLAWKDGRVKLDAKTERLDAARLARIAGFSSPVRRALVSVDAKLEGPPNDLRGTVRGDVASIAYARVNEGAVAFDLTLERRALSGMVSTELVPGSRVVIGVDELTLPPASGLDSWAPLGRVRANGTVDLTCLSPLVAGLEGFPFEDAEGSVKLDLAYARESAGELPELSARIRTHDLVLVGRRAEKERITSSGEAIDAAPVVYRGVDAGLDVALDRATRRITARVGAYDDEGSLLSLDAEAGPLPSGGIAAGVAGIRNVPLEAHATVPERRLRTLPASVRPVSLRGNVSGELSFTGTLAEPKVALDARVRRLGAASERIEGQKRARVSLLAHAEYERHGGRLELRGDRGSKRALAASASWEGDLVLAASDPEAQKRLQMRAEVTLDELDLETIPALKNRQIEGLVSGAARVEYGPGTRSIVADLKALPLRVGQATVDRVHALVKLEDGRIDGTVDVKGKSGSLEASLESAMTWPAAGLPAPTGDVHAKVSARKFRLATLWPLVSGSVNELDGRLDADLAATVAAGRIELRGKGRIDGGVVQIPAIGQRFDAIAARIAVDRSSLVIEDVRARGITGAVTANARLEVDEQLGLRHAKASVNIAKAQKIPVTVEGVALGDAWGRVDVDVQNRPEKVEVVVRVPEFQIDVPDSSGNDVQDLAPNERVRIGARRADAKFVAMPLQPLQPPSERTTPLSITVELGNAVRLRRGEQVNAQVSGKLHVLVTDETDVTGEILIREGSLDVSGKRFEIERGTVTFSGGEPSNPQVYALARWDSPAGYSVYASYVGSAKNGKLTLRAEPPLTQDEILNLLLFGTPEGSVSSGGGDSATSAVGVAGGTAAQGLNRAISDLTTLDIQARVDTSTGDARPELVVPLTRRLSARVTRAIGEPAPGASPDRTFLTLELRLKRHWALSALFGDRGATALDLVWRRHY